MGYRPGSDRSIPADDLNSTKKLINPRVAVIHTMAGNPPAKPAHWSINSDGYDWQHRDDDYQSSACYQGNYRCWALEFDDHGPEFEWVNGRVPEMTAKQVEKGAKILVYLHEEKGLSLTLCPSSLPTTKGVGWHRLGIDGNFSKPQFIYPGRIDGGEQWSTSFGKICPDDKRITQVIKEMLPRARELAGLDNPDMQANDEFYASQWSDDPGTYGGYLHQRAVESMDTNKTTKSISARLTAIESKIANPELTQAQLDYIINGVAAKLQALRFTAD